MRDDIINFIYLGFLAVFCLGGLAWVYLGGNIVSDVQRDFLKESVTLKQQCELPLPRTQQCVLQYIPEQQ